MANNDEDDWRAQREAALAGTPFARPSEPVRDRTDDTLPIQRSEPIVPIRPTTTSAAPRPAPAKPSPVKAEARPATTRSLLWPTVAGIAALVIAAVIWVSGRDRTTNVQPVAPSVARVAPPQIAAPPVVTPPTLVVSDAPVATSPPDVEAAPVDPTIIAIPMPRLKSEAQLSPKVVASTTRTPVVRKPPPPRAKDIRRTTSQPAVSSLPIITVSTLSCSSVSSRAELAICASPALTARVREERELYETVAAQGDAKSAAKAQKSQIGLIKRRERCKNDVCIDRIYARQITTLQKMQKKAAQARVRAAEKLLPPCTKLQRPAPGVCRAGFSLRRLLGIQGR